MQHLTQTEAHTKFSIFKAICLIALSSLPDFLVLFALGDNLSLIKNQGAAFGLLKSSPGFVTVISIIAFVSLSYAAIFISDLKIWEQMCFIVIAGGTSANLTERVIFGAVLDWIPLPFSGLKFNLADVEIVLGALGILVFLSQKEISDHEQQSD